MERIFCFVLPLKAEIENVSENLQMEFFTLQCDINPKHIGFLEKICKTVIPTCQKESHLGLDTLC
jgi:hypothetical protein